MAEKAERPIQKDWINLPTTPGIRVSYSNAHGYDAYAATLSKLIICAKASLHRSFAANFEIHNWPIINITGYG